VYFKANLWPGDERGPKVRARDRCGKVPPTIERLLRCGPQQEELRRAAAAYFDEHAAPGLVASTRFRS
jgi:hypothetical protein